MRQTISATLKTLILAAGLSLAAVSFANEPEAAPAAPDAAKGEALYTNGDAKRGVAACMGCHGANGVSGGGAYPKLAGQHASYVVKQLKDYKAGKDRANPVMSGFAGLLSDEDMANGLLMYQSKHLVLVLLKIGLALSWVKRFIVVVSLASQ